MSFPDAAELRNRPGVIFAALTLVAVLGFAGVTRLTKRYHDQQKAVARRLYARGLDDQKEGQFDNAISDFRAALSYDRDNFYYELSLARALRDNGRMNEAEAYLVNLWERTPQDGFVNLALGRLAARQSKIDKAIQYYHNAIYGVWPSNAENNRRTAEFELIAFLLRQGAQSQAEAELIAVAATLPPDDVILQTHVAQLLAQVGMHDRALALFKKVLQEDRSSKPALDGAANSAFELGHYRSAEGYLRRSLALDPHNEQNRDLLETITLVLEMDPYDRRLSTVGRIRRLRAAFDVASKRLSVCLADKQGVPDTPWTALQANWMQMKGKLSHLTDADAETFDAAMDLINQIEQHAQLDCGPPARTDRALLLLSATRFGAER
ncbi:MAG TPA: tetratricopeptide repeat protein [Terriglobales bacterium]